MMMYYSQCAHYRGMVLPTHRMETKNSQKDLDIDVEKLTTSTCDKIECVKANSLPMICQERKRDTLIDFPEDNIQTIINIAQRRYSVHQISKDIVCMDPRGHNTILEEAEDSVFEEAAVDGANGNNHDTNNDCPSASKSVPHNNTLPKSNCCEFEDLTNVLRTKESWDVSKPAIMGHMAQKYPKVLPVSKFSTLPTRYYNRYSFQDDVYDSLSRGGRRGKGQMYTSHHPVCCLSQQTCLPRPCDTLKDRNPLLRKKNELGTTKGGRRAVSEALQLLGADSHPDSTCTSLLTDLPSLSPIPPLSERKHIKSRRMSTPSPIKSRSVRSPPSKLRSPRRRLRKSKSAPDLLETCGGNTCSRSKRLQLFHACSAEAGDLALQAHNVEFSSDDEASEDGMSLAASETSSASSSGKQNLLDELFEEQLPTCAEALWDHVTMDMEELAFGAGDVIEVSDHSDKDWWWGRINKREGWFPAAFVRMKANQSETADDLAQKVKDGAIDTHTALLRYSQVLLSKDQARTNVIREIIHAEREYVKHLRDVVEGYVEKARKRPEMFSEERLKTIFGNIEDIYMFSATFLADLEKHFTKQVPQLSELGQVFLRYKRGFEIYSEYCNNHPHACEELMELQKNRRYQHFFEACRLLQQMMEIPLEGFLLTPVQKICKYPLQLKELLKYTRSEHPDHDALQKALESMKQIAVLINERKRKMESIERLAEWQDSVDDWQGPDLLETSSELIYSGELSKVNSGGWHQERVFFLFDHQLIYCKKDLLWRDMMVFKGSINTDNCVVHPIQDGKDITFNVSVKHAFKIYDHVREKWYLLYCRNGAERERWLRAFQEERNRCKQDRDSGFRVKDFRRHLWVSPARHSRAHPRKHKGKQHKHSKDVADQILYDEEIYAIPSHVTLPRQAQGQGHGGKRSWFPFRKIKR